MPAPHEIVIAETRSLAKHGGKRDLEASDGPQLHGLVLAGGESRRMGRDKAALELHGRSQVDWAFDLLSRHCERVFVSVRPGQEGDPARSGHPTIVDRHTGVGPIAGIAAALAAHPEAAWLVVACDLPLLSDATLEALVAARGREPVTAFRSAHDGLPEPLCAIYEPSTRPGIEAAIARANCPRNSCGPSLLPGHPTSRRQRQHAR
jgi:molybdopterin-guanine dinucleotide biosynthesis protein A